MWRQQAVVARASSGSVEGGAQLSAQFRDQAAEEDTSDVKLTETSGLLNLDDKASSPTDMADDVCGIGGARSCRRNLSSAISGKLVTLTASGATTQMILQEVAAGSVHGHRRRSDAMKARRPHADLR